MNTKNDFPEKKEFPSELQNFYLATPKSFDGFNEDFNLICLLVNQMEIDDQKWGIFSDYGGKRPDQIHYSIGIGLIEEKSSNYRKTDIENKFDEFITYFEHKYNGYSLCVVKYCILIAEKLSESIKREIRVDFKHNNRLEYVHRKKQFEIQGVPVYFVRKSR